jgi:hypothetical protein
MQQLKRHNRVMEKSVCGMVVKPVGGIYLRQKAKERERESRAEREQRETIG